MPRAAARSMAPWKYADAGDGDTHVGVEHILLGLLDPKGNMAVELLRHLGAEPEVIRVHVLTDLGKAA